MNKFLNDLERKIGKYAIVNLTKYIVMLYAVGYVLQLAPQSVNITNLLKVRDKRKKLFFITYDEESRKNILDNIRRQGFSVVDLFQETLVDFILSSKIKDKDSPEYTKFSDLLEGIH